MSSIIALVRKTFSGIKKDVENYRFAPSSINTASIIMAVFDENEEVKNELDDIFNALSEYLDNWRLLPLRNSRSMLNSIKTIVDVLDCELFRTRPQDMSAETIVHASETLQSYAKALSRFAARI